MAKAAEDGRLRAFFALWPGPEVARALHEVGQLAHPSCGGRLMHRDSLHLTLAFLGEIDAGQIDAACDAATKVGAGDTPLRMAIDRLGYWQHNHIVWAGCSASPPGLAGLADTLAQHLCEQGLRLQHREFVAHATLLRDARCAAPLPALSPIVWEPRDFVLVASEPVPAGRHYRVLRRWSLG